MDREEGTEPVPAIIGLGAAADLAVSRTDVPPEPRASARADEPLIQTLRDRLYNGLKTALGDDVVLLGHPQQRLPNTLAVGFRGRIGGEILAACPQLCASTGAACHSGKRRRSSVLEAMDVPEEIAFGAIRFSLGRYTTQSQIDQALQQVIAAARHE